MQAIKLKSYGGPEVLELHQDTPIPTPKTGEVLVKIMAVGINPFDQMIMSGALSKMIPLNLPITFGGDIAGVVEKLGDDSKDFKVGDKVFGTAIVLKGGSGGLAEYAVTPKTNLALMPETPKKSDTENFLQAAALPVAGLTAIEALADNIQLQSGQKILIHGGAGGVGHYAIQYAKSLGAYVATTVATRDVEFVKSLGADEVIDYSSQHFEQIIKNYDAVFDAVGDPVTALSYGVLKPGGVIVLIVSQVNESLAKQYHVKAIRQQTTTNTVALTRLAKLIEVGTIIVNINKIFSLHQISEAYKHLKSGHPRGKVVIDLSRVP